MKTKRKWAITLLLYCMSAFAGADDWTVVGIGPKDELLINFHSAKRNSKSGDVRFWVRQVFVNGSKLPDGIYFKYSIARWWIDCTQDKVAILSQVFYGESGDVVDSFGEKEPLQTDDITPDSIAKYVENKICTK
jgi:hypothetical protein